MKKIIATLMVLAFFSASVFALPASMVTTLNDQAPVKNEVFTGNAQTDDDLFASVQAIQLTDTEAAQVEGEGWFDTFLSVTLSVVIGSSIGGVLGAATGASVTVGTCTIPASVVGAVSVGIASGVAALTNDGFAIKVTLNQ